MNRWSLYQRVFFASLGFFFVFSLKWGYAQDPSPSRPHPKSFDIAAKQAYLIDLSTHTLLLEKNADELMAPSSMTKILTVYLIFEKLQKGELKLTDTFPVSERAWRMGGSKMFVKVGDRVSVEDLLQGIIVQSGNDACIVIAEGLAGSEENFAELAVKKAKELGAKNTHFLNSTGWPNTEHLTTARDLALIAEKTMAHFPEFYARYYPQRDFTYNKIRQHNRNPLLAQNLGDGLKTGHTDDGGYGLVGSGQQQGRRLLFVINGLPNDKARKQEAVGLINWGFREFQTYKLFSKEDVIEKANVWVGDTPFVSLRTPEDVLVTLRRSNHPHMKAVVRYKGPIEPPIARGQLLGEFVVIVPGEEEKKFPLIAGEAVERAGFFLRVWHALHYLLWGKAV